MPESLEERFPGNSNKDKRDREAARETRDDIQPIVKSGRAAVAKKPLGKRILDSLFNNDDAKSVADYILNAMRTAMKHPTPRKTMTFTRIQIHQVRNPTARIDKANMIASHTASLIRRRIP